MKKRILPLVALAAICLALLCPVRAQAQEEASLTLYYQQEGYVFPGLDVGIYHVANMLPNGMLQLVAPYTSFPLNIQGVTTQTRWDHIAETLWAYILDQNVAPNYQAATDSAGTVCFSGIQPGLYFVPEITVEHDSGKYLFRQFLVYVPTPLSDGTYDYSVEARPKCANFVPRYQYSVTKLWEDSGYQSIRPQAVTVKIYQGDRLWDTQVLSADNSWTYSWSISGEDPGAWTVVEADVPSLYRVRVQEKGGHFSIINTYTTTPDSPQTGDGFRPLPWILAMCLSGFALVILGLRGRRSK